MPVSENVSLQVLSGAGGLIDEQEQSFHCSQEWYPLTVVKLNAVNLSKRAQICNLQVGGIFLSCQALWQLHRATSNF